MGPKMCALAGAEADGVFLNWMTPEKAAWARERVHEGAAEAGRDSPPLIFGYVRVAVGPDAGERLLKEESFYRQLHQGYIRHFEALGQEPGTVGVAATDPPSVGAELAAYEQPIDHVVVRGAGARGRGVARRGGGGRRAGGLGLEPDGLERLGAVRIDLDAHCLPVAERPDPSEAGCLDSAPLSLPRPRTAAMHHDPVARVEDLLDHDLNLVEGVLQVRQSSLTPSCPW